MMQHPRAGSGSPRSGFTLLEIAACAAMLAMLLLVVGKTIVAVETSARRADEHAEALSVVENLLEEVLAAPWEAIDAEAIARLPLPAYVQERWPAVRVTGMVESVDEPLPAKRISLGLSPRGGRGRSVTMTTWIYRAPRN